MHTVGHMTNICLSVPDLVCKYLNFCNRHMSRHVSRNTVSCHFRQRMCPLFSCGWAYGS